MGDKRIDPRQQFSKKLACWTAWFWFLYMLWLSVVMVIQPGVAMYSFYMSIVVSVVMMLNVAAYTRNSIYEKAMLAALDKTKIELSMKKTGKGSEKDEEGTLTEEGEDG